MGWLARQKNQRDKTLLSQIMQVRFALFHPNSVLFDLILACICALFDLILADICALFDLILTSFKSVSFCL